MHVIVMRITIQLRGQGVGLGARTAGHDPKFKLYSISITINHMRAARKHRGHVPQSSINL